MVNNWMIWEDTLWKTNSLLLNMAIESSLIYPMLILHSYVSLPEGNQ
jgi:hypothetical protein